jgi:phage I-like protein
VLELNFKQGEKVKVSPIGAFEGVDGRSYSVDGKALIKSIVKGGVHIVLDANHSFGEAVGWFDKDSFELQEDGIYATLEFNSEGMELISDKKYRYLSPVYIMGDGNTVVGLDSVGLVNRPNLLTTALNTKEEKKMTPEELDQFKKSIVAEVIEALNPASLTNEITVLKEALVQTNKKLNAFAGESNFDSNTPPPQLSENEKQVAMLLGVSQDAYLKTKMGGK